MKFTLSLIVSISYILAYCQQSRIDSLENLITSYPYEDTVKMQKLIDFSRELMNTGNYEKAIKTADDAVNLSEKLGKDDNVNSKLAVAYKYIGINYYYQGNYSNALEYFVSSAKIYTETGDKKGVAGTYNNIGEVYRVKGNYDMALDYYFKAIKILDEFGDELKIAAIYNNVGMLQKDYKKALEFYVLAVKKYEESSRKNPDDVSIIIWMGNSYANIGNVYKDQGELDDAIEYYYKALKIREKTGDKKGISDSYIGLGLIYAEKSRSVQNTRSSDFDKALDFYNKALILKEEIGDRQGLAMVYGDIGILYLNQNDIPKSKLYLLKSLHFAKEVQSKPIMQQNYLNLSQCDSALGNYKDAYEFYKLFTVIKDSVFNTETAEKTAELQTRYESEKKEKEIELLKKDGEIQHANLKQQKLLTYSVISGLLLMAFIAIFVYRSLHITRKQKHIIEIAKDQISEQKKKVEEHQKEIIDSINYAKRIQFALLAHDTLLNNNLPEHFVLFKPKDIVSGDFYWATHHHDRFYLAVCDSTGHGVPGAFMSLLNISFLNEAINEKGIICPNEVLDHVRMRLVENISQDGTRDGMDAVLVCVERPVSGTQKPGLAFSEMEMKITYAAANNAPVIIRNGKITALPYDKMPVGKGERAERFTLQALSVEKGDSIYLFTDGFADQFGGPKGKKFKYKQLEEKLSLTVNLPMEEQKNSLNKIFTQWKGNLEQVDDVCIIGIRA